MPAKITIKSTETKEDVKVKEENKTGGEFQEETPPTILKPGQTTEKYITEDSRITVEEKKK